jgi:hypothetical protein
MSSFVVNVQTLEALQGAVMGLAVELENAPGLGSQFAGTNAVTGRLAPDASVSGGELNGADVVFSNFFTHWQSALGQIGNNMEAVAKALANAAEAYAENEDHVCLVNP